MPVRFRPSAPLHIKSVLYSANPIANGRLVIGFYNIEFVIKSGETNERILLQKRIQIHVPRKPIL